MATVQFSAVLVCCAYFLSSSSASHSHKQQLEQLNAHATYISHFPCLHPQVNVIPVHKLLPNSKTHGKAYYPDVTVLHRCDESTGSCTSGHKCHAKTSHAVILPFKATYLQDIGNRKTGTWKMEYYTVLNHTECACAVPSPRYSFLGKYDRPHKSEPSTPSVSDLVGSSTRVLESNNDYSSYSSQRNKESATTDYLLGVWRPLS